MGKGKNKKLTIVSVRASSLKFAAVLTAGILFVTALVIFLPPVPPQTEAGGTVDYANVESPEDMVGFLGSFGITASKELFSDRTVTLPDRFDGVFAEYNELQKRQGFDLSRFSGRKLRKAILRANAPGIEGDCLATLFIYRGTVVGGDISSVDPNGGVWGFDLKP